MKEHLILKCRKLDILSNVIFTGRRNDIPAILKVINIFIFPSFFEGMGNALLEAMLMEKACVVSDIDVFKEVILNGHDGIICSLDDKNTFADIVIDLIPNKKKQDMLGQNARDKILSKYTVQKRVENTINIYKEVLNKE
jgi:glycosyltransferase involved in cell wall biosynthesis